MLIFEKSRDTAIFKQCCGSGSAWIWIRMDLDPHGSGTFAWIRNYSSGSGIAKRERLKEHVNKTMNSGLFVLLDRSIE